MTRVKASRTLLVALLSTSILAIASPVHAEDAALPVPLALTAYLVGSAQSEQSFEIHASAGIDLPLTVGAPTAASWLDPGTGLVTADNALVGEDSVARFQIRTWGSPSVPIAYGDSTVLVDVPVTPARTPVVAPMRSAFTALYAVGYRIRSMHPVDVYGHNPKGIGGNDYASMAAGNTSMFICRYQVGKE